MREVLARIAGTARRLLALRSYLRGRDHLAERWSWTQEQIQAFEGSPEHQDLQAEIERARHAFESFLVAYQPVPTPTVAAPGLSPHGQVRAVDFQVHQGDRIIAGPRTATIATDWDANGWSSRLDAAVRAALPAAAVPFWGAKQSSPADTAPGALKPGEFVWNPVVAPAGPIVVVVSLTEQRSYVYRNGVEIGFTTVSTGKPGHATPTGVFTILQKDKDHRSSKYNNAPMPYQQRLTWDGVALHAGGLPGYPESHGCVHLPSKFAEELFGASHMGMTVVVVDGRR